MIEKYLKNKTIMSAAGIVTGLVLMIWRGRVIEQMIRVVGFILLAAAAVYLLMYFRSSRQNETQLGYAIAAAAAGILLIMLSRFLLSAFPRIIGIVMIVTAAATLLKTYNNGNVSLYSKLLYLLVIAAGIVIAVKPGGLINTMAFFIGVACVVNGVSGLVMSRQV